MMLISWIVSAVVLVLVGIGLGLRIRHSALGILIDQRGRYSLTQLQWTERFDAAGRLDKASAEFSDALPGGAYR